MFALTQTKTRPIDHSEKTDGIHQCLNSNGELINQGLRERNYILLKEYLQPWMFSYLWEQGSLKFPVYQSSLEETEQGLCSATRHAKVSLSSYTIHSYKRTAEKVTHMGRNGLENNPKGTVILLKINRKVLCPWFQGYIFKLIPL